MHRWIFAVPALLLLSSGAPVQDRRYPPESRCVLVEEGGACGGYSVSIVELIANPRIYDGKRVQVIGWLRLEFESNGIYLHHEDQIAHINRNGLWVEFASGSPGGACAGGYANVVGTFNAGNRGHRGAWSGSIEDIDGCTPWPPVVRQSTP